MPHRARLHRQFFPGESINCACGEDLQTREHILRMCTRYTGQRGSLRDENREIALPELPGTPKGIAALTAFLQDSGAFTFTGEEYTPKNTPLFEAEQEPPQDKDSNKNQSRDPTAHARRKSLEHHSARTSLSTSVQLPSPASPASPPYPTHSYSIQLYNSHIDSRKSQPTELIYT